MTTFTYSGYFTTHNPDGSAKTLKAAKLDIVVDGADSTLRYTRLPGDEAITVTSNIIALRVDGRSVSPPTALEAYTSQIDWLGIGSNTSNIFIGELPDGQFTMQISGNTIPQLKSAGDYNAFLASIVHTKPLTFGFYGPDTDIPYDRIMTPKVTENDRIDGTGGKDTFNGGTGDDKIFGLEGKDKLIGGNGDDRLEGGTGNDNLQGGKGKDKLIGDEGKDTLIGGKDADTFIFQSLADSTVKSKGRDVINDFKRGDGDKIYLKAIDARSGSSKNDKFKFIGQNDFSGKKGELRYEKKNGNTFVYGDVDGDAKSDFAIQIKGKINLTDNDFVL